MFKPVRNSIQLMTNDLKNKDSSRINTLQSLTIQYEEQSRLLSLQAMAYEDNLWTRVSHFSYEIRNNRIKLYPPPESTSFSLANFLKLLEYIALSPSNHNFLGFLAAHIPENASIND